MTQIADIQNLLPASPPETLAVVGERADIATRGALARVADKIGRTRRPGAQSDIPAGATYLAQFAALDLAQRCRESGRDLVTLGGRVDLVYGDGPRSDAACYQLRAGRTRPKPTSPASGALRDLPRSACPHLDAHAADGRAEVLVPDTPSDSNLILGQIHVLWALLHNAAEARFAERMAPETGRLHEMPLSEAWLIDFARFFAIVSSVLQRPPAIGPHVACPFAASGAASAVGSDVSLVLRDLVACMRGGLSSVRSLISRAALAEPRLFEGCFAQDEAVWQASVADWLSDAGLGAGESEGLAGDPPLTLFLMLEAEADTGGRTLGALGSVLMGETLAAALPAADDEPALATARRAVFEAAVPASMADLVRFLQRHHRFAEGARLHPAEEASAANDGGEPPARPHPGERRMFDTYSVHRQPVARIEVGDYIELGRLVAQWATEPATRPASVAELRLQLDGIAVLPDRIKTIAFEQSSLDHLVFALPATEMVEESLERVTDPLAESYYPLPQFYADHYRPGFGPVMTPLDTLFARMADFTIAQCR